MEKISVIEIRVRELLEQVPTLRESDEKLYITYVETYHYVEFNKDIFANYKDYDLPSFKSIERARRKLQNEYGICEANEDVREERREAEKRYKNYATDNRELNVD